jgi:hypothetical protein
MRDEKKRGKICERTGEKRNIYKISKLKGPGESSNLA